MLTDYINFNVGIYITQWKHKRWSHIKNKLKNEKYMFLMPIFI